MSVFDRLKPGRPKHEQTETILKMRLEGYTYENIAYLLGDIPRQTVATICQRHFKLGRYSDSTPRPL